MKTYVVKIHGIEHTFLLADEEAERRGLTPVEEKAAPKPENKARSADNK